MCIILILRQINTRYKILSVQESLGIGIHFSKLAVQKLHNLLTLSL